MVGDRWSLLIVRELLIGPRRYGALLDGLPGIATNLLADRLRQLEDAGVVARAVNSGYMLTPWGEGLRASLYALARWSAPIVMGRPVGDDAFRSEWLAHPVAVIFDGIDPRRAPMRVEVRVGDKPMTVESANGEVRVRPGSAPSPEVILTGPPDAILGLLAGHIDAAAATEFGVQITGDGRRLTRLRPSPPVAPVADLGAVMP